MMILQAVTSGANPISIKKGIDKTCDFLVGKLKENSKPVKGTEDIKVGASLLISISTFQPVVLARFNIVIMLHALAACS